MKNIANIVLLVSLYCKKSQMIEHIGHNFWHLHSRAQWGGREEDGEEEEEAVVGESEDELSLTFSEVPRLPSLSCVVWYITLLLHDGVHAQQVWSVRKGWPLRLTLGRPGSPRNLLSHLFFSLRKTKHQSSSALRVAVRSAWRSLPSLARSTLGQRQ